MRRWLAVLAASLVTAGALAQRMDPRRPETLVVGAPAGASPMSRGDANRSAQSSLPLPAPPLRVAWRKSISAANAGIEHAPLVGADGRVLVMTTQGEAVWLDVQTGEERGHLAVRLGSTSAPAALSSGTYVVVASNGDAVGFTSDGTTFRTPLGGDRSQGTTRVAPLPLPDGGVAVATSGELAVLDATGNVRARASTSEALGGPLLAVRGKVLAVAERTGVVYAWAPGGDVIRVGSFGGSVDGGAALLDAHTLVAMIDPGAQSRVVTLDVDTGVAAPRASAPVNQGYLGPPTVAGGVVYGLGGSPTMNFVIGLDSAGREKLRAPIPAGMRTLSFAVDGGVAAYVPPAHVGLISDRGGALAFAAPDGTIGVVDAAGVVATLPMEGSCSRTGAKFAVSGLATAKPGAFVVTCANGSVLQVASAQ